MHHTINDNPPSKKFCLMLYTFPISAISPTPQLSAGGAQSSEQSPVGLLPQVLEEEVHQTQKKGAVPGKDSRQ